MLSIPGVCAVIASSVLAELGDITRFSSFKKFYAFTELSPKRRQTGRSKPNDKTSCEVSKYLRTALFNGMLAVISTNSHWRAYYHKKEKTKGWKVANLCVSKKILNCIYYLTINDCDFDFKKSKCGWVA